MIMVINTLTGVLAQWLEHPLRSRETGVQIPVGSGQTNHYCNSRHVAYKVKETDRRCPMRCGVGARDNFIFNLTHQYISCIELNDVLSTNVCCLSLTPMFLRQNENLCKIYCNNNVTPQKNWHATKRMQTTSFRIIYNQAITALIPSAYAEAPTQKL